jgi:hypothetical protein
MNKVVKDEGFGNYRVLNERGQLVGTFFFSRSKTKNRMFTTCRVKPRNGAEFKTSHCYFADVRRDAINGNLFS